MANVRMQKEKLISILIPVYNEAENIYPLYQRISEEAEKITDYRFQIIFVNDGSTDRTREALRALTDIRGPVEVKFQNFKRNRGKTEAIKAGIDLCEGEFIINMDGDLQDDPEYLEKFVNEIQKPDVDFVIGNRTNKYTKNIVKRISSAIANKTAKLLIGSPANDMNCGFKAMTAECAFKVALKSDYHRYYPLLASIEGFRISQVDIEQKKRLSGESKYGKIGLGRSMNSALDMLSIYFIYRFKKEPFRLFGRVGLLIFGVGALILIYLTIGWLMGHYIYGRPLFFMGILFCIVGTNILGMGLLGELIVLNGMSRESTKNKP